MKIRLLVIKTLVIILCSLCITHNYRFYSVQSKNYVVSPFLMTRSLITWNVYSKPRKIESRTINGILEFAFDKWSTLVGKRFERVYHDPDIVIEFVDSVHKKLQHDIHFSNGILAHAFAYPHYTIHIDRNITFSVTQDDMISSEDGVDLYTVLMHEIGHVLGFVHNPNRESVMFPSYNKRIFYNYTFTNEEILHARNTFSQQNESVFVGQNSDVYDVPEKNRSCSPHNSILAFLFGQPLVMFQRRVYLISGFIKKTTDFFHYILKSEDITGIVQVNTSLFIFQNKYFTVSEGNVRLVENGIVKNRFGFEDVIVGGYYNEASTNLLLFGAQNFYLFPKFSLDRKILVVQKLPLRLWSRKLTSLIWVAQNGKVVYFAQRDSVHVFKPRYYNNEQLYKIMPFFDLCI